ncbi:spore germination protein [Paenibacillus solisilvae]|uniref:Spore germination protein n=1 Tax=Paenibacillus solisilvae TaxID=2486751 RepID=A0ABW0W1H3_9BACL
MVAHVALVSVNPDVMKLELTYSIAQSRVGVPYPSITETVILLFIIEMLFDAIHFEPSPLTLIPVLVYKNIL